MKEWNDGEKVYADDLNQNFAEQARIFGDGADGAATISSNTTLTRDMYYTDLTINNGIVLNAAGYDVYVSGDFVQIGTGKIANAGTNGTAGGNASGSTGGSAGSAGTSGAGGTLPAAPAARAGQAGGSTDASGGSGAAGVASANSLKHGTPTSFAGANGGQGGGAAGGGNLWPAGTGGAAGTVTAGMFKVVSAYAVRLFASFLSGTFKLCDYHAGNGGAGAASGGRSFSGTQGGGGGGSGGGGGNGGFSRLFARRITTASNPIIDVSGGNGGNGGNGAAGSNGGGSGNGGGGGGGNGGNGGVAMCVYGELVSGTLTASVNGGTKGNKGTKGVGGFTGNGDASDGQDGNNGANGLFFSFRV